MSAAFDCVDQSTLLLRLERNFGVTGFALQWMTSFLIDRTQEVAYGRALSKLERMLCGVPQGSVLGPLLFNMYTSDISKVVVSHGLCKLHQYDDDCQVYLSVPVTEAATAVDQLSQCVANVSAWLSSSRLRLNPSKTLVIWLGGKHQVTKVSVDCVPILSMTVPTVERVRDLGLVLDSQLTMYAHVNSVCRSAYYQLRPVMCSLSADASRTVAQAFVSSRLDYCNSVMYGAANGLIKRLQAVQNAAAWLVTGTRRRDHISPVVRQLHWLPVHQRVTFKLAILVFKALHGLAPRYLADNCQLVTDAGRHLLRSWVGYLRTSMHQHPIWRLCVTTCRTICLEQPPRQSSPPIFL